MKKKRKKVDNDFKVLVLVRKYFIVGIKLTFKPINNNDQVIFMKHI